MIILQQIFKEYNNCIVLKNINIRLEPGKIYVLKGVSGSGKTTLLNILGGIDTDFSGKYLWKNIDATRQLPGETIGYMFQHSLLISGLSVMDNLRLIKDDMKLIEHWANQFGVADLLERMPDTLSGGERQRISLIRALLNNPYLLLADEPTASLDQDNSAIVAKSISQASNSSNIIVIATHENCFDEIADEIIYLNYGTISTNDKNRKNAEQMILSVEEKANKKDYLAKQIKRISIYLHKYSLQKQISKSIFYTITFFLLFLSICIQYNLKNILLHSLYKDYPITVFSLSLNDYESLKEEYNFVKYENFSIAINDIHCYGLFDELHSGLAVKGVIEYGHFPENEKEVIVNREYILRLEQETNPEISEDEIDWNSHLNANFTVRNHTFRISGILSEFPDAAEDTINRLIFSNSYYQNDGNAMVFIPYHVMSEIGDIEQNDTVMVSLDNIYTTSAANHIRDYLGVPFSVWDREMESWQNIIDAICYMVYGVLLVICIVAVLFIQNEIMMEFHYRKREIGYLQIFGLNKKEISMILYSEKFLKYAPGIIGGLALSVIVSLITSIVMKHILYIPVIRILCCTLIIIIYITMTVKHPCRRILKKNVQELIS